MNAGAWAAERADNETERRATCREHSLRLDERKRCAACVLRNRASATHAKAS